MERFYFEDLQNWCKAVSIIKESLIENLPHYGHQALYFENDEITSGLLNNKIEIKIHLLTGRFHYYDNERNYIFDLINDRDAPEKISELSKVSLKNLNLDLLYKKDLAKFHIYAVKAKRILELFRQTLVGEFTLIHLWPHHFDFSVEWFTGKPDQQIGIGISPGDKANQEPYIYMTPWPFSEKMLKSKLPIGQWNTIGWNGIKVNFENLDNDLDHSVGMLSKLFFVVKTNFT